MEQELKQGRQVINKGLLALYIKMSKALYIYSKTNSKTMHEMISTEIHNNHNNIIARWNGWMLFTLDDTKNERENLMRKMM